MQSWQNYFASWLPIIAALIVLFSLSKLRIHFGIDWASRRTNGHALHNAADAFVDTVREQPIEEPKRLGREARVAEFWRGFEPED